MAADSRLVTFTALSLDVTDVDRMGPWWAQRLGWQFERPAADSTGDAVIRGDEPGQELWLQQVPESKSVKNRVHLDLRTHSGDLFAESPRLSEPGRFPWTVYVDPEGNEFCVFSYDDPDLATGLKDIVVDVAQAEPITQWWADVMGGDWDEDEGEGWIDDVPNAPIDSIDFVTVSELKSVKNRLHWHVRLEHGVDVRHLVQRGATIVTEQQAGPSGWTVMADPQGNEFCVFPAASG